MIDAHLDTDRFPAVAHGQARWSLDEAAHLERCPECRLEWNLMRSAQTLGRVPAESIGPERIAASVTRRLKTASVSSPHGSRPARWVLAVAAAAAIVLAVAYPRGNTPSDAALPSAEITVLNELDGLTPAELEAVLEAIPPAADDAMHVEAAPIEGLTTKDLERVLRSLE